MVNRKRLDFLASQILAGAIRIHRALGPALLESVYQTCMLYELRSMGLFVEREVAVPVRYRGLVFPVGFRIDLLVEKAVVIELKTVKSLLPVHEAQLLSYLRMGNYPLGLLINFYVPVLKDGIKRMINVTPEV